MIPNFNQQYTYEEYLKWDTEDRYELIYGVPYLQAAPSTEHQRILANLAFELMKYFKGNDDDGKCEVFLSPFDVRLIKNIQHYDESKVDCVVQPDISVVCDKSKIDKKGCIGNPDLVVEILSDSTASKDYIQKLNLYQLNEIKEYWIVSPKNKDIQIFRLNKEIYGEPDNFKKGEIIKSKLFQGLEVNLANIFTLYEK